MSTKPLDLSFFNVIKISENLLTFDYITNIIYNPNNYQLVLEYKSGNTKLLGSVESDDARSINGATVNSDGELIITFNNFSIINVGKVVTEYFIDNDLSYNGRGYHVGDNSYIPFSAGNGTSIGDFSDLSINFNPIIVPENENINETPVYDKYTMITENRAGQTAPFNSIIANQWNDRYIDGVNVNNIGISIKSDYVTLSVGTYYVCYLATHYKTDTTKLGIRDSSGNVLLQSISETNFTGRESSSHIIECTGYLVIDEEKDIKLSFMSSSTNNNTTVPTSLSGSFHFDNTQTKSAEVHLWKISDEALPFVTGDSGGDEEKISAYIAKLREMYTYNNHLTYQTNQGTNLAGSGKWSDMVIGNDGKLYCIPYNATTILIIDEKTNDVSTSDMGANLSGGGKWHDGVLGNDGKIYGIPWNSTDILIIDPATQTATRSDMGANLSGNGKWVGGVLGNDGKIYGIPWDSADILIIDPATQTATRSNMGTNLSGGGKWHGGVLGNDSKIYGMPSNSGDILIIDPATETATRSNMGANLSGTYKWFGYVLGNDSKIYGIPLNANDILIIDPATETASRSNMGANLSGTNKWLGGVLGNDGKIYGIPWNSTDILIIDPVTQIATMSNMGTNLSGTNKWYGGVASLGNNGVIYGVPRDASDILMIDTDPTSKDYQKAYRNTCFHNLGGGGSKWTASTLANNGKIFCSPLNNTNQFLIIDTVKNITYLSSLGLSLSIGSNTNYFSCSVLGGDGNIYVIPDTYTKVVAIDPDTETATEKDYGLSLGGFSKWVGAVLSSDGRIFAIPFRSDKVLVIDPINDSATLEDYGLNLTDANKFTRGCLGQDNKIYCVPNDSDTILVIDPANNTALRSNFGADLSGTSKYSSGMLGWDGKLYFFPRIKNEILVVDTENGTATTTNMGYPFLSVDKFNYSILGRDGKIYLCPRNNTKILIVDTKTKTVEEVEDLNFSSSSRNHLVASNDLEGNIYFIPFDLPYISKISFNDNRDATYLRSMILGPQNNRG